MTLAKAELSARERLKNVRSRTRLRAQQLVSFILPDFEPRTSPCDALLVGEGTLGGRRVGVLAQQKPSEEDVRRGSLRNYGMVTARGYWHVADIVAELAERQLPIIFLIDTPGADPSESGAKDLLAWAISGSISALLKANVPTVSCILGEGGSGGALAMQIADVRLMASDAIYSVIAPESCSAILFRDTENVESALTLLKPWAEQVLAIGGVDALIDLDDGAALHDHPRAARRVAKALEEALDEAGNLEGSERVRRRLERTLAIGSATKEEVPSAFASASPASSLSPWRPDPRRFRRIQASDELLGVLQHAYFGGLSQGDEERLLCPRTDGGCGAVISYDELKSAAWSCPFCGRGERIPASRWIEILVDDCELEELHGGLDLSHLTGDGYDTAEYQQARAKARDETGVSESLRVGVGRIDGVDCAIAISEFGFFGGTLGAVAGEKLRRLSDLARHERLPLVTVTSSGGARMQEGTLALLQMAKSNAAALQVMAAGLPVVSVLADPCTGGALGSYATCATAVLAEPRALVAFAGPRVMKLSGLASEPALLISENVAAFGGIDEVTSRRGLASRISRHLRVRRERGEPSTARSSRAENLSRELQRAIVALVDAASELFDDQSHAAHDEEAMQKVAALAVSQLSDLSLVSVPALLAHAARSPDARVRANAVEAISRMPQRSLGDDVRALFDAHHRVRANAAIHVLSVDPTHELASACLEQLFSSSDPLQQRAALYACVRLAHPRWSEAVRALASSADLHVSAGAGAALLALGHLDEGASVLARVRELGGELGLRSVRRFLPLLSPEAAAALRISLGNAELSG